jgi:hypothetical protein
MAKRKMNARVHVTVKGMIEALKPYADFEFIGLERDGIYVAILRFRKLPEEYRVLQLEMTMKEIIAEKRRTVFNPVTLELYKREPFLMARNFMFKKMVVMPGFFERYLASGGSFKIDEVIDELTEVKP